MSLLGDEGQGWRDLIGREPSELLGRVGDELAVPPQHVAGVGQLEEHRPAVDLADRREIELQRGRHAEVSTATAHGPEQILVLAIARREEAPVSGDHVDRAKGVQRQAQAAREIADTAPQRETADAGGRDDAAGGRQAERTRRGVEVAPGGTPLGPSRASAGIHLDPAHARQVDHDPTVGRAEPRHAVATAADRHLDARRTRVTDRRDDVTGVGGADHGRRAPVDHGVVHRASIVVAVVFGRDHGSSNLLPELFDRRCAHRRPFPSHRPPSVDGRSRRTYDRGV